jgi:ABC-type glycerol-3-phosphate transport system substrate-binding protein
MQRITRLTLVILASAAALAVIGSALTGAAAVSTIVFCSERDGDSDIYTMNADGSGLASLTNHSGMDRGPSWLPAKTKP